MKRRQLIAGAGVVAVSGCLSESLPGLAQAEVTEELEAAQSAYGRAIDELDEQVEADDGLGLETAGPAIATSDIESALDDVLRTVEDARGEEPPDEQVETLDALDVAASATRDLVSIHVELHTLYTEVELVVEAVDDGATDRDWADGSVRDTVADVRSRLGDVGNTIEDDHGPDLDDVDRVTEAALVEQVDRFRRDGETIRSVVAGLDALLGGHDWFWRAHHRYSDDRTGGNLVSYFEVAAKRFEGASESFDVPAGLFDDEAMGCHADAMAEAATAHAQAAAYRREGASEDAAEKETTVNSALDAARECDFGDLDAMSG